MRIKRQDGTVFEFEALSFGRGQWATNLVAVNGSPVQGGMGDPDHRTRFEANQAARRMVPKLRYVPNLGWCSN